MRLLKSVFSDVVIPSAVFDELVTQGSGWAEAEEAQFEAVSGNWLRTIDLESNGIVLLGDPNLDDGEREVISLAFAWGLIPSIDEPFGRREAEKLAMQPIGTLGILGIAKQHGLIAQIGPTIQRMRMHRLRFGNRLIESFLVQFEERWPP